VQWLGSVNLMDIWFPEKSMGFIDRLINDTLLMKTAYQVVTVNFLSGHV
jgi:hypothetical protein